MRKLEKLTILIFALLVSCVQPVLNNKPSPNVSSTISGSISPSNVAASKSPIVFIPKKGKASITGIFRFDKDLGKLADMVNIDIYDSIAPNILKFLEVKKEQTFIIDDIPILDKHGTNVNLRIISHEFHKYVQTKVFDSQLTDIGTITFTTNDIDFFSGESISIDFIVQDKNNNPIKGGLATDITGGIVDKSKQIMEDGKFYIMSFAGTVSFKSPRKIEIKSGYHIMTILNNKEDYHGLHKISFTANARTVFGYIFDSIDKNKPVAGLKVKVLNQDIAVRTNQDGHFELRGVPFDEVTVEIDDTLKVIVPKVTDSEERKLDNIYYSSV